MFRRILGAFFACMLITTSFCLAQERYNLSTPKSYSYNNKSPKEYILFIMDSSLSMEDLIENSSKIDIAKRTLKKTLTKLPASTWAGLRVYGHRSHFLRTKACQASDLRVPIAKNTSQQIINEINNIVPTGLTPITYSLELALTHDLAKFKGKKRIILFTDGGETCGRDPCEFAIEAIKTYPDIKIDIIAFSMGDYIGFQQLKCAATVTRGKIYNPSNEEELADSLYESFNIEKEVQGQILQY